MKIFNRYKRIIVSSLVIVLIMVYPIHIVLNVVEGRKQLNKLELSDVYQHYDENHFYSYYLPWETQKEELTKATSVLYQAIQSKDFTIATELPQKTLLFAAAFTYKASTVFIYSDGSVYLHCSHSLVRGEEYYTPTWWHSKFFKNIYIKSEPDDEIVTLVSSWPDEWKEEGISK